MNIYEAIARDSLTVQYLSIFDEAHEWHGRPELYGAI